MIFERDDEITVMSGLMVIKLLSVSFILGTPKLFSQSFSLDIGGTKNVLKNFYSVKERK